MKNFWYLLNYELRMLIISPATYIAGVLFTLLMAFLYLFILESYTEGPKQGLPSSDFFQIFWLPVLFTVPLLTMRSFSEEKRLGTLDCLLATPTHPIAVVLAKFLSAYLLYISLWVLTLFFPHIVGLVSNETGLVGRINDIAATAGGITFVCTSGVLFIALGIFFSSLTRSQIVAGMLTFSALFLIIVGEKLLLDSVFFQLPWVQTLKIPVSYLNTFKHLEDFSKGIIDTRPFFLYISNAFLLFGITSLSIEAQK